jgi:hypothetical protein
VEVNLSDWSGISARAQPAIRESAATFHHLYTTAMPPGYINAIAATPSKDTSQTTTYPYRVRITRLFELAPNAVEE